MRVFTECCRFLNLGVLMVGLLCMLTIVAFGNSQVRCVESERRALLKFKQGLDDGANLLSSWTSGNEDCCRWRGVGCNNQTGHVVMLDLRSIITYYSVGFSYTPMGGEVGSSLLDLRYLNHLDLSWNGFTNIPQFIGSLSKLTYLNLSHNILGGTIPVQLGNLSRLRTLDLSYCGFSGTIPVQLGNLSRLRSLDLSSIALSQSTPQPGNLSRLHSQDLSNYRTDNLEWLSRLSSLRILNMGSTSFTKAVNWPQSIKSHPSLSTLYLLACEFPEVDPSSLSHINSSNSLAILHLIDSTLHPSTLPVLLNISSKMVDLSLSNNKFKGPIPDSFENMPSLEYLDFSYNQIEGGIPKSMGSLCSLQRLDLSKNHLSGPISNLLQSLAGCTKTSRPSSMRDLYLHHNKLEGAIPDSIGNLSKLAVLRLANNQLTGSLPETIGNLSKLSVLSLEANQFTGSLPESIGKISSLRVLDVSLNSLNDVISEVHLSNLIKLQHLDLSYNSFALNFSSDWVPPFQLYSIKMRSCKLGPLFPSWLRNQKNFSYLDISNSSISDAIPSWFWNLPSELQYLNLSCNLIHGEMSNLPLKLNHFPAVDLSSNLFSGPVAFFLSHTTMLNLSKNMFSGSLSFLCATIDSLLNFLDLSDNQISGSLPHCWMKVTDLYILNLENNNLSGMIPSSIDSLYEIETLRLRNNSISGKLPSSLKNCKELKLLDLGENQLTGKLPEWIGESLSKLILLRLRSNKFFGNIPSTMCHLDSTQILDLSFNNLSGTIPPCLNNLSAMVRNGSSDKTISSIYISSYNDNPKIGQSDHSVAFYNDSALVIWKGVEQKYGKTLGLLKLIDLSSNNLTGGIPGGVTNLLGLHTLNLSRNNLTGTIPKEIGQLKALESLDLSSNQLSGEIPRSLANINDLGYLNLSNNQLLGKIPVGPQLQTFDSAYLGNSDLCGLPLPKKCPEDETMQDSPNTGGIENNFQEGGEWFDKSSLYAGLGVGFAIGFWGFFGPLLFNRSWRYAYLRFLNDVTDSICLTIALKVAKLQRRFQS